MVLAGLSTVTGPRLSILVLHRVLPQADALFPAELDAARFDRLMAVAARSFQVLRLSDAVRHLQQGTLPARALCITFDDGYADNHDIALPILKRHGLPACFFIATGFLDGGRMFNDTVIECLRLSPLSHIDLGEFGLGRFDLNTAAQRAEVIGRLMPVIKFRSTQERAPMLDRLRQLCQANGLPDDLMMTRSQVQAMHAAGMEIGAHTVHHPILCKVTDEVAEQEIAQSRAVLQGLTDHPVSLFAYPNGRPGRDYALQHVSMVKRLGFAAAVSTSPGVSSPGDDRHQLPRFTPWESNPRVWMSRMVGNRRRHQFETAKVASTGVSLA